jgi:hypothetical protein
MLRGKLSATMTVAVHPIFLLKSVIFKKIFANGSQFKNSGQTLILNFQPDPDLKIFSASIIQIENLIRTNRTLTLIFQPDPDLKFSGRP